MPVCLPKAIFKRSTKNLRQATAQLANGALSICSDDAHRGKIAAVEPVAWRLQL